MSIDLDQETQRLIELEIQAGGFRDASAFVSAAVRHFLITREDLGSTREQIDEVERHGGRIWVGIGNGPGCDFQIHDSHGRATLTVTSSPSSVLQSRGSIMRI